MGAGEFDHARGELDTRHPSPGPDQLTGCGQAGSRTQVEYVGARREQPDQSPDVFLLALLVGEGLVVAFPDGVEGLGLEAGTFGPGLGPGRRGRVAAVRGHARVVPS